MTDEARIRIAERTDESASVQQRADEAIKDLHDLINEELPKAIDGAFPKINWKKHYAKPTTDEEVKAQFVKTIGEPSASSAFGLYRIHRERDGMSLDDAYNAAIKDVIEIWTSKI